MTVMSIRKFLEDPDHKREIFYASFSAALFVDYLIHKDVTFLGGALLCVLFALRERQKRISLQKVKTGPAAN